LLTGGSRMESDSFFFKLFKRLPQTFFELLDLPAARAKSYRFDSVEVKKSLRIDGLFLPKKASLPLYFVEVQFQRVETFYANLFAKVFCYLEENDPAQEWIAVAIFPSRKEEPKSLEPYEDLLASKRVKRVYLTELLSLADPPPGLALLQLAAAPDEQTRPLVDRLIERSHVEYGDSDVASRMIELVEELLIRRFSELNRGEVRKMFHLEDLRKTRVWQEAHEEGIEKGSADTQRKLIEKWLAEGRSYPEIGKLLGVSVREVRRLMMSIAAPHASESE
jgi:predicted transposase/invertase (TIGR01784 family)